MWSGQGGSGSWEAFQLYGQGYDLYTCHTAKGCLPSEYDGGNVCHQLCCEWINWTVLIMGMVTAASKAPRGPTHQFFHWTWAPGLTCLVKVVSGHLKQAQVHVGDGVEGATGQEHHGDSALHLVSHIHARCSSHPAFIGTKTHVRELAPRQVSKSASLSHTQAITSHL